MENFFDPCYGACIHGMMNTPQLIHQQSAEDADLFIDLFEDAIRKGYDPNNAEVQQAIFSRGQLGGFDYLMKYDQQRVTRRVEEIYKTL